MRHIGYIFSCFGIFIFFTVGRAYAITGTSSDTNFFSNSYKAQQENRKRYNQDGIIGFTQKINNAIRYSRDLKSISDSCGGCDVILPEFDTYLTENPPIIQAGTPKILIQKKLETVGYGNIILGNFLHSSITRRFSDSEINTFNTFIAKALTDIVQQTGYQTGFHNDLIAPGSYTDGDMTNSPYDLMNDIQKILKLLFKDPFQYEGYTNSMQNDASGLITGRFETGQWAQGERYEIDIASDVASALGQDSDTGGNSYSEQGDCEEGFCITLDVISNDAYFVSGGGTAFINTNLEEIFSSGNEWLIKKGDKRNIACKAPVGFNFFQSNNDQNLSLKNIFRGLGIFIFFKTPRYANNDRGKHEKKTVEQKERDMDGVIAESFKRRNIDPENLMLYTQQQMVEKATPLAQRAGDSAANQEKASYTLKQRQDIQTDATVSIIRNETGNPDEGVKNVFRSFGSWMSSFRTMIHDMLDISKVWKDKPDCGN